MSSNNIKWAFNLFRSSSNTFKQSSLIFYGDQEILPLNELPKSAFHLLWFCLISSPFLIYSFCPSQNIRGKTIAWTIEIMIQFYSVRWMNHSVVLVIHFTFTKTGSVRCFIFLNIYWHISIIEQALQSSQWRHNAQQNKW